MYFFSFFQFFVQTTTTPTTPLNPASRSLSNNLLSGTIPTQLQLPSIASGELFLATNPLCYNVNYTSWAAINDFSLVTFCAAANCPYLYGATCSTPCPCNTTSATCFSGKSGNGTCVCSSAFTANCNACALGYYGSSCSPGNDSFKFLLIPLLLQLLLSCFSLTLFLSYVVF